MPSGLIRIYLFLIFLPFLSYSQDVQWASKVLGFSSENVDVNNQGPEYRAIQILGKPNVLPRQEKSKCAWSPTSDDGYGEEWIKVGYETPIHVSNIVICENIGAGAIIRVMLYDEQGKEYIVKEDTSDPPKEVGRVWNVQIPLTDYKVTALKLLLAPSKSKGINQIDAVGISNNAKPYEAKVNISSNMPKEILKENLGKAINSKGREVAPIITPDGRTLFFTREGHEGNIGKQKKQDVWVANTLSGGIWGDALNIAEPINSDVDNAVTTISADGKTVYILNIYLPNGTYLPGLSKSKKSKGGWEYPREVKITDYYNQSKFTEFSISSDGKTMIMACKRKDTKGGKDFYVSFLNANSTWTKPVNMVGLNTAEDESTPFIAADSKTLYFSTRGYPGFGDNDIFLSRRLDSTWTNWSEPENLGNLINTARWDGYFTIPASGEFAYLSSEEKSMGAEDIFRIKMFPSIKPDPVAIISGTAFNVMDKKPIAADVVLEVLSDSSTVTDKSIAEYDPETGEYKVVLPLKKMYALTATKKGFLSVSETVDLTKEKSFREIKKNIGMFPIKEGTKVILNNLFFNQSKFDILPSSYSELTRLVEVMLEYPRMEVLIEGHTDGNDDLNLNIKLSENRANEVKKFLVEKGGIEANRIQTKGWGPTKPISSNVTEETRKKNRRVEFSILKL